jgi:hypothetical protein
MTMPQRYWIWTLILICVSHAMAQENIDHLAAVTLPDWQQHCDTYYSSGVQARFTRDDQVRRSSKFSLHINHLDTKPGTALYQTAAIPAWEGCTFYASVRVKTRKAMAAIAVRFLDDKKAYIQGPQQGDVLQDDGDWNKLTVSAIAPPGTVAVHVFLICRQGESWFDDLSVRDNLLETARQRLSKLQDQLPKLNLMKSHKQALHATIKAISSASGSDMDRQQLVVELRKLDEKITDELHLVLLPSRGIARVNVNAQPGADGFWVTVPVPPMEK